MAIYGRSDIHAARNHDPRNPNWKPFQYLEQICRKCGYDEMEARDIIEEQIGRTVGL